MRTLNICLLLAWLVAATGRAEDSLAHQLSDTVRAELKLTPSPHFVVQGLELGESTAAKDVVKWTVQSSTLSDPPAILGEYKLEGKQIEFYPRFPLSRAVVYQLHIADGIMEESAALSELQFSLPEAPSRQSPAITAVYPSADVLPENLLKFYIHFSQPMSRGEAYQRIQLFEGKTEIEDPFLELGEELWDMEQTRFTLFIHPGRIKRGVQPRELRGAPITEGKQYTLRIAGSWRAANGELLGETYEKKFSASAAEHDRLDPTEWQIETPLAGSRAPVGLTFDSPLDHAMLNRVLTVKYNDGTVIKGAIEVLDHETRWLFMPTAGWKVGAYYIEVATIIEDLAGNSVAKPFEVDMRATTALAPPPKIAIEFIAK